MIDGVAAATLILRRRWSYSLDDDDDDDDDDDELVARVASPMLYDTQRCGAGENRLCSTNTIGRR